MQRTRLNTIVEVTGERFNRWLANPWRRFSLQIIMFFAGFLGANVVNLGSGQAGVFDPGIALLCLMAVELISWLYYRSLPPRQSLTQVHPPRPLWLEIGHSAKLGFIYGLFLDAFKLGS